MQKTSLSFGKNFKEFCLKHLRVSGKTPCCSYKKAGFSLLNLLKHPFIGFCLSGKSRKQMLKTNIIILKISRVFLMEFLQKHSAVYQ